MTIWKSPIFYFGIILVLAVSAALVAPYVVDWNQYRPQIEKYGAQLSGRDVKVGGPIKVRLFPWPQLNLDHVRLANPAGFSNEAFTEVERVDVRVTLAGLITGTVQVESVDVVRPVINLTRDQAGNMNWFFAPDEVLQNSKLLDHVKLDTITITQGTVRIRDEQRNFDQVLTGVTAALSAPAIVGPWRVQGVGVFDELPLDFTLTTTAQKSGAPVSFGLRVAPQDISMPVLSLDGGLAAKGVSGKLELRRSPDETGKESIDGSFPPFLLRSDIEADFTSASLQKLQITPLKKTEGSSVIEGDAVFTWAKQLSATINLKTPRLDLTDVSGPEVIGGFRQNGGMVALQHLFDQLSDRITLKLNLGASQIDFASEKFENVKLVAEGDKRALRVSEFSGGLPGRTRALFDGIVFSADNSAEMAGTLAIETQDLRQFLGFIWPEGKPSLVANWTGSRGQLKAEARLDLSAEKLNLQNLRYSLDGEEGTADAAIRLGNAPALDLRLDAATMDIDRYLPEGVVALSINSSASWFGFIEQLVQGVADIEKRFTLQLGTLKINGVEARDVVIDVDSSARGITIKDLEVGAVGGAAVQASGSILNGLNGPEGVVDLTIKAEKPLSVLQLMGLGAVDAKRDWTAALGKTDLRISLAVKPGGEEPVTDFEMNGTSGDITIALAAGVQNLSKGAGARVSGTLDLQAQRSSALLQLIGMSSFENTAKPAKAEVTFSGTLTQGGRLAIAANVLDTAISFAGDATRGDMQWQWDGGFSARSLDAAKLGQDLGLPVPLPAGQALDLKLAIKPDQSIKLDGSMAGEVFSGDIKRLPNQQFSGDFVMPRLALSDILALSLLPWQQQPPDMETAFAKTGPFGVQGEFWLRPELLNISAGSVAKEAQVGLVFGTDKRQIAINGRSANDTPISLSLDVVPQGNGHLVKGRYQLLLNLQDALIANIGQPIAVGQLILSGAFNGAGRNALSIISDFSGSGTYTLEDSALTAFSPQTFTAKLADVKDAEALSQLFAALNQGPGMPIGTAKGTLSITNGMVALMPFTVQNVDADLTVKPSADLVSQSVELAIDARLKARAGLPAVGLKYYGPPNALAKRSDVTALSAMLGFGILERGVAELERVQAEQERALKEEEKLRKIDEQRFNLFQAQKAELRLRNRELKLHAVTRANVAAARATENADAYTALEVLNEQELNLRMRELRTRRGQLSSAGKTKVEVVAPEQLRLTVIRPPARKVIVPSEVKLPVVILAPMQAVSPPQ